MSETNDLAMRLSRATPAQQSLHNNFLSSLDTAKRGLVRSAFFLAAIADRKVHKVLGYRDAVSYAIASGGLSKRQAQDLLRMGRKLRHLPQIASAIDAGVLSWGKARLIVGSATPETERELLDIAKRFGHRKIEKSLRQERSVDPENKPKRMPPKETVRGQIEEKTEQERIPNQPKKSSARSDHEPNQKPIHVNLSFTPEEYARWEAAIASWPRRRGESLAAVHLDALTRPPHHAPDPSAEVPGMLLVILECPKCRRATIPTSRGELPAHDALLATAHCDAIVEQEQNGHVTRRQTIPPQLRRQVLRRDRYRCQARSCGHARHLEVHHRVPAAQGGRTELNNLVTLCRRCHRRLHAQEQDAQRAVALGQDLP